MKVIEMNQEEISVFADGELALQRVDFIAQALRHPAQQDSWNLYHQIGDILRSDDMAIAFSADFSARMAARIDAEPIFIAPASANTTTPGSPGGRAWSGRGWLVPGLVAAATAVYFVAPQWLVASRTFAEKSFAQASSWQAGGVQGVDAPLPAVATLASNSAVGSGGEQAVVLRDPRIDEYLLAHQRFSPSMYSSAQFARSATFASDANK